MKINELLKLPDLFTVLNVSSGMLSIFFAIRENLLYASVFLLIAVLCDYLDGKAARLTGEAHEFGKELDSLADAVSFGAAPAVFGFMIFGCLCPVYMLVLIIFVAAGILRLARFNITKMKGGYEGMPITTNGIIFPAMYFLSLYLAIPLSVYAAVFLFSAVLMLSTIKIKKVI